MGRPRKPTEILKLQGTFDPSRRPGNELSPDAGIPECPDWLSETARAEWERITPLLESLGLLAEIDAVPLAMYCHYYGEFLAAKQMIDRSGLLIQTPKGFVVRNPATFVMRDASAECRRFAVEFGFTPASRTRIDVKPGGTDELSAYLNAKPA